MQPSASKTKLSLDLSSIVSQQQPANKQQQQQLQSTQPSVLAPQPQPQQGLQLKQPLSQQLPDNIDDVDFDESDDDDLDDVDFELINELKSAHAAAIKTLQPSAPQPVQQLTQVPISASLDRDWDSAAPQLSRVRSRPVLPALGEGPAAAKPANNLVLDEDDEDWGDIDLPAAPAAKAPALVPQPSSFNTPTFKKLSSTVSQSQPSQASAAVTAPDDDLMDFEAGEAPLRLKPGLVSKDPRKSVPSLQSPSLTQAPGSAVEPGVFFDPATGKWQSSGGAAAKTPDDIDDAFAAADAEDAASASLRAQASNKGTKSGLSVPGSSAAMQQAAPRVQSRSEIPLGEFDLSEELLAHFRQCQRQHELEYASAYRDAEARGFPVVEESAEELTAALLAP
jgi:hypothetical protein